MIALAVWGVDSKPMLGVAQRSAETDDSLDFLIPQRKVSGDTVAVLKLRVTGNLVMSCGTRIFFGRLDERPTDALPLQVGFHVPALDECHW